MVSFELKKGGMNPIKSRITIREKKSPTKKKSMSHEKKKRVPYFPLYPIGSMGLAYLPTFTINIKQM